MDHPERPIWRSWLNRELFDYADPKHNQSRPEHDRRLIEDGCGKDSWWFGQIGQYLQRGSILGLDTLNGRQAVMKGLATYVALVESMIRTYGPPPKAGYPSGEIV